MPKPIEVNSAKFYIVDASVLIQAYVDGLTNEQLMAVAADLYGFDHPETTTRQDLFDAITEEQSNSDNITFGDTEYALVALSRWMNEYQITGPFTLINSDEGVEGVDPSLIFVNMGQ